MALTCLLPNRAVLEIGGADAADFLQNLLTNDVEALSETVAQYTLLLTPQGKYLFDFFLLKQGDRFLAECDRDALPLLMKRLTFYKLRAKVSLTDLSDTWSVGVTWGDDVTYPELGAVTPLLGGVRFTDPRLATLGARFLVPLADADEALQGDEATARDYDLFRLSLGVPTIGDLVTERSFPMEANLDLLHGIDFHKGCFIGQEVTSRTYRQGKIRKRLLPVSTVSKMPAAGSPVMAGQRQAGELHTVRGPLGIALLRLDRLDMPLDVGGLDIEYAWPNWLPTQAAQASDEEE